MDDELFEYLLKRPSTRRSPVPQVTSLYFDIDCCIRFLRITYDHFLLLPTIIKKAYRYYFIMRSHLEEEQEQWRKKEEDRKQSLNRASGAIKGRMVR